MDQLGPLMKTIKTDKPSVDAPFKAEGERAQSGTNGGH